MDQLGHGLLPTRYTCQQSWLEAAVDRAAALDYTLVGHPPWGIESSEGLRASPEAARNILAEGVCMLTCTDGVNMHAHTTN